MGDSNDSLNWGSNTIEIIPGKVYIALHSRIIQNTHLLEEQCISHIIDLVGMVNNHNCPCPMSATDCIHINTGNNTRRVMRYDMIRAYKFLTKAGRNTHNKVIILDNSWYKYLSLSLCLKYLQFCEPWENNLEVLKYICDPHEIRVGRRVKNLALTLSDPICPPIIRPCKSPWQIALEAKRGKTGADDIEREPFTMYSL